MSIMKDLINITLMIMLLLMLYKTDNQYTAIIYGIAFMFLYSVKYIRLNKIIQRAVDAEAEKQKQFFMEILTHDLKTPTLAQLRGLELIQKDAGEKISPEQKELVGHIKDSCKYVLDMISQVLRIYNLENGIHTAVYEKVNMEKLLLESFSEVDYAAKEKNVEFVYLASGVDTILEAEKNDIKIAIINLLLNAVVYSNYGEKIFIKFERFSQYLKFEIITKGIILTEDECRNMFNAALSKLPRYSVIGHGINLYLCKIIADCYKGKIYAQTDGEIYNKFTLELPLSQFSEAFPTSSLLTSY